MIHNWYMNSTLIYTDLMNNIWYTNEHHLMNKIRIMVYEQQTMLQLLILYICTYASVTELVYTLNICTYTEYTALNWYIHFICFIYWFAQQNIAWYVQNICFHMLHEQQNIAWTSESTFDLHTEYLMHNNPSHLMHKILLHEYFIIITAIWCTEQNTAFDAIHTNIHLHYINTSNCT